MEKNELLQEGEKKFIFTLTYKLVIFFVVIFLAFYLGSILFGTRSIEEMLKVNEMETQLKKEIKNSKKENEKLQRKLFNYEVLVPDKN